MPKPTFTEEQLEALRTWVKAEIDFAIKDHAERDYFHTRERDLTDQTFEQVKTVFGDGL